MRIQVQLHVYIKLLCLFLLHFGFIHNQGTVCNINQVLQIFNECAIQVFKLLPSGFDFTSYSIRYE